LNALPSSRKCSIMKTTPTAMHHSAERNGSGPDLPHFQIYRQGHAGNYHPEFSTDSAKEAVEAFLAESPAFEGGELRIWNTREQRPSASVQWVTEKTDLMFPVRRRLNVFHDPVLAVIAGQLLEQQAMRETIQQQIHMTV
jgi:hypothetical protein